jgi:3-oxoacyl-[acyl-carrier protein] reductase
MSRVTLEAQGKLKNAQPHGLAAGAGKGIGEAAALMFAKHGAMLLLTDLDPKALETAAAAVRAAGSPQVVTVAGDITAPDAAQKIVAAAQDSFGRLDVLVNNAGYTWDGVIHKMADKQWQAMLDVHITAPFKLIQAAAPLMREAAKAEMEELGAAQPRSIINISSVSGTHGNGGQANYASGKSGVVGLTKTVAKEWGPFNIRCNAIAYGFIDTRLTRAKEGNEAIVVGGEKVSNSLRVGGSLVPSGPDV